MVNESNQDYFLERMNSTFDKMTTSVINLIVESVNRESDEDESISSEVIRDTLYRDINAYLLASSEHNLVHACIDWTRMHVEDRPTEQEQEAVLERINEAAKLLVESYQRAADFQRG